MKRDGYHPLDDDKILDPLTDLDLQGLRSRESRSRMRTKRSGPVRKPRRRKIGRFILLFLLGLSLGWLLHSHLSSEVSDEKRERRTISSSFQYPVEGIRLERISTVEKPPQVAESVVLAPDESASLSYSHESLRFMGVERRSSLWATVLDKLLSPPALFVDGQMVEPGSDLSDFVKPEDSLSYVLFLRSSDEREVLASFQIDVEMDAKAWLTRSSELEDPELKKICYEMARRLEPQNVALLMKLSDLLVEQNDIPAAIKGYQKVLELNPGHVEANRAMAPIRSEQEPKRALEIYRKLLKIDPDHRLDYYRRVAHLQERLGIPAADTYKKILSLNRDDPDARENIEALYAKHVERAQALEKKGSISKAIEEMKAALDIQSSKDGEAYLAALYNNLAYELGKDGKLEVAIDKYRDSLKYDQNAVTYLNLADAHLRMKQPSMAVKALEKAASLKPKKRDILKSIYMLWADLLLANHQTKKAVSKLKEAQKHLPQDAEIIKTLGVTYWEMGDLTNALDTMNRLSSLVESASAKEKVEAFGLLGDLHRDIGARKTNLEARITHLDRALKAYERALSLNSGNRDIQEKWDETAELRKSLKIKALQSS